MSIKSLLSEHSAEMAVRNQAAKEREAAELRKVSDEQIAKRVQAEELQRVLREVVKPVLEYYQRELAEDGFESFITESQRSGIMGFNDLIIGIEIRMNGKQAQRGEVSVYRLVFEGDCQHPSITACANTNGEHSMVVPGVHHMAVSKLDAERVRYTFEKEFLVKVLEHEKRLAQ